MTTTPLNAAWARRVTAREDAAWARRVTARAAATGTPSLAQLDREFYANARAFMDEDERHYADMEDA